MATIRDVAKLAGVSVATVSHVINGTRQVSPETATRVRRAMEALDYQPNAIAQSLRTRNTLAVGVLVSDITNPFFATLVRGTEDAAISSGYSLVVCNSDEDFDKENLYVQLFLRRRRMDGIIVAPARDGTGPAIRNVAQRKTPYVFVDRKAPGINGNAVLTDNVDGAYQATRHLIERGHRRIGIVLGIPGSTTTEERFLGYRRALDEAGLSLSADLVVYGDYRIQGGERAAAKLLSLSQPPTAIFSINNLMTVGVLHTIFRRNLRIPNDVAVVGFDDLEWAELVQPPLTVVEQQPYEIGQKAFAILLELLKGERSPEDVQEVRIPAKLKIREST